MILTRQLATRSHVSTNVRLDKSRDAKTSLLLANNDETRDAATSLLLASAVQNHVTPQSFCCAQQQFKPRDAATSLLLKPHDAAMSLHKNQLLPHFRRSMTCASCSSPAIRAQEPSNHWSQQLPEVPPTDSDDTITIALRPPTDLTTETEPRIESPKPHNY